MNLVSHIREVSRSSREVTHIGRGMIECDVQDDLELPPMTLLDEELEVVHGAEDRIDLVVIADVVSSAIGETTARQSCQRGCSTLSFDIPHIRHG